MSAFLHLLSIDLYSTHKSVDVDAATIKTTNGRIEGSFHASKSLSLITSNGPIRANVSLYHDNATDANVDLTMKTSNG